MHTKFLSPKPLSMRLTVGQNLCTRVHGAGYAAMASKQQRQTIEIPAGRGTIYDRTGEPLAIGEQATTVYADPRNVVAPKKAAVKAAQALGLNADDLYPSLKDRTKQFVYIERKADPVRAKELQRLGVAGIGLYPAAMSALEPKTAALLLVGASVAMGSPAVCLQWSTGRALAADPRTPRGPWHAPSASGSPPSRDDRRTPAPPVRHSPSSRTPGWPHRRPAGPDPR